MNGAATTMGTVVRYHPLLVVLHWLLALLIPGLLALGFFGLATTPNTDPQKIALLRWHMAGGALALALMPVRFLVRMRSLRPARATTGHAPLDRMAPVSHYGFYVLVLLMAVSGFETAFLAGLPAIVFGGSGAPLPASFMDYAPRVVHGVLALVLVALIAVHVSAALYHQLVRKDHLLRRMSFGQRKPPEAAGPLETD